VPGVIWTNLARNQDGRFDLEALVRALSQVLLPQSYPMILNLLLIVGGLVSLIATGVFLFELNRAPLGVEDETGCHILEKQEPHLPAKYETAGAGEYSHSTPHAL
jgi:sensor histidine kinase regulating citrate/malate metabolism